MHILHAAPPFYGPKVGSNQHMQYYLLKNSGYSESRLEASFINGQ